MCGIVGYIGGQQAAPLLLEGLTRLEHRGYDSAGVAVLGGGIKVAKRAGRVREIDVPKRFTGKVGIGHTRWATHGPRTEVNAHPHLSTDGKVAVVHNGIIDNAASLREALVDEGVEMISDTDSEVLAHSWQAATRTRSKSKVRAALARIDGTYGVAVLHEDFPDRIVVARNGSPLIIGVGEKEMHVASDLAALVRYTTTVAHLDDGEMATLTATGFTTYTTSLSATRKAVTELDIDPASYDESDHESFMYKEILEQPAAAERMLRGRLDERFGTAHLGGLDLEPRETRAIQRVKVLGCGSAYYVGQMGASMIEELARVPADAEAASEFRYRNPIIEPDTLYVAVSQSGETIDTLLAVQEIKRKGGRVIGLVNVVGSAIARECDGGIYLHAGPEVAVASTKALTNMYLGFALLALHLGRVRDLSIADGRRLIAGLQRLPGQLERDPRAGGRPGRDRRDPLRGGVAVLRRSGARLPGCARGCPEVQGDLLPACGGLPTSELKHGPLALISADVPDGGDRSRRRADRPQRGRAARDRRPARAAGGDHAPRPSTWAR